MNYLKKWTLVFCFFPLLLAGQTLVIDSIVDHKRNEPEVKYSFPFVKCKKNKVLADSINSFMQRDYLSMELGKQEQSVFENVWGSDDLIYGRMSDIGFHVNYNNAPLLSVTISGESCGMYCEQYTVHYNFDTQNKNKFEVDTVFTKAGLRILSDSVRAMRDREINRFIKTCLDTVKFEHEKNKEEDDDMFNEMIQMYRDCMHDEVEVINGFLIGDCDFYNDHFTVFPGRCSAHYNMVLDELWDFEFDLKMKDWKQYLSEYGKTLFKE